MNLSQEIQTLQERLERRGGSGPEEAAAAASLYRLVASNPPGGLTLVARELQAAWARDILTVRKGSGNAGGQGLQVSQPMFNLQEGDLVLEVNGESVVGVGEEEWAERRRAVPTAHHHHHQPWRIVVGRRAGPPVAEEAAAGSRMGGGCAGREEVGGGGELAGLQEDIALIQSRLEEKLREGRDMGSILHLVQREKEGLERENTRLNHRIFYLEEQVMICFYSLLLDRTNCMRPEHLP